MLSPSLSPIVILLSRVKIVFVLNNRYHYYSYLTNKKLRPKRELCIIWPAYIRGKI